MSERAVSQEAVSKPTGAVGVASPGKRRWKIPTYVWYLSPFCITIFAIVAAPLAYSGFLSLTKYNLSQPYLGMRFAGISNYLKALSDPDVFSSVKISIAYVLFSLTGEILIGLLLALVAVRGLPGTAVFRVLLLSPLMLTPSAVGLVWKFFYNYTGLVNYTLGLLGMHPIKWFTAESALLSVILVTIWQNYPFSFLVILAGLQTIPKAVIEAAEIDGASAFKMFTQITLPLLRSFVVIILVIRTINVLRYVDLIFTLTYGGPGKATETFSFLIYTNGFSFFEMGYGSALSFLLIALSAVITWLYMRLMAAE